MISWSIFNENQSSYTQKKGFFKPVSAEKVSLAADKRFCRYKAKHIFYDWRQIERFALYRPNRLSAANETFSAETGLKNPFFWV